MSTLFDDFALAATLGVGLAVLLRWRGWGIALPLIVAGALVDWLPFGPDGPPDPEVVLLVILAPLVFGEAMGSSYLDLRRVSRQVLALAVGLVIVTTTVVGVISANLTAMPLALGCALGAVLAPTDAVAVSAVARRAGLPRRVVAILEGESLVNDGTGLTALTVALAAAAAGTVTVVEVTGIFVVAVGVGVGVGLLGGWALALVLRRSQDLVGANALVLVAPFLLYALTEELHGSGILALVVAALVIAHSQHSDPGHTGRVQSATVWRHVTFILQAVAFFFVGLELPEVLRRLDASEAHAVAILAPTVIVTLIVTRAAFVLGLVGFGQLAVERARGRTREAIVVAWAGARGPVSGLAAFSVPIVFAASGAPVPYRDVIVAVALIAIVVTLLLSLTLAPLSRALGVRPDDDDALVRRVRAQLARAALERLTDVEVEAAQAGAPLPGAALDRLRADAERRARAADPAEPDVEAAARAERLTQVARAMVRAEQEELLRLRDEEGLPDAIVRPMLRDLDVRARALHR